MEILILLGYIFFGLFFVVAIYFAQPPIKHFYEKWELYWERKS